MTGAPPAADPFALLAGLPLEDGQLWGDRAQSWQRADARAFFDRSPGAPRRHFLVRGRGLSKTSDLAGVILALLLTEAPAGSRSYVYAADGDQAGIMLDRLAGFVQRAGLGPLVEVGASTVTNRSTGATVAIEASDGASAFGKLPWLTVVDEFSMWPATDNYKRLWSAITSALTKVDGSRLIVISMGGSPSSLAARWWPKAERSAAWRTARQPGPSPWARPEDVAADREALTDSEYRQLVLGEWAEGDDAITTAENVVACIRAGEVTLPPTIGRQYVAALDVGTRRDLTAFGIGHTEQRPSGRVVVIDLVMHWRPGKGAENRVDLSEVEATVLRLSREYRIERLRFDRMQAEQLTTNLARAAVRVKEYVFSAAGAARVARSLHVALRDRAIELPDDDELRSEANTVRMVETGPGLVKMSNPPGTHDDVLTVVGMIVADLTESPDVGGGGISIPSQVQADMKAREATAGGPGMAPTFLNPAYAARLTRGGLADVYAAQRGQTEAQRRAGIGLVVSGSANDPSRSSRQ